MNKAYVVGGVTSFVVAIVLLSLIITRFSAVVGYGILFIWILFFGIFMWILARQHVQEKLSEDSAQLTRLSHPEVFRHTYDYLCPACLYQTNDGPGLCPQCKRRELMETYKHPRARDVPEEEEEQKHVPL